MQFVTMWFKKFEESSEGETPPNLFDSLYLEWSQ